MPWPSAPPASLPALRQNYSRQPILLAKKNLALFDLGVGWPRQTCFELRQRPIRRGEHDVVSPVRFGRAPHPSRTALSFMTQADARVLLRDCGGFGGLE